LRGKRRYGGGRPRIHKKKFKKNGEVGFQNMTGKLKGTHGQREKKSKRWGGMHNIIKSKGNKPGAEEVHTGGRARGTTDKELRDHLQSRVLVQEL